MEIKGVKEKEAFVFTLAGRLDVLSAPEAKKVFKEWLDGGESRLVGDLSGLDYVSSAGLRVLLEVARAAAKSGGGLSLFGLKERVREVFEVVGLESLIPLFATKAEALAKLKA